jgi:hypothetical protein
VDRLRPGRIVADVVGGEQLVDEVEVATVPRLVGESLDDVANLRLGHQPAGG